MRKFFKTIFLLIFFGFVNESKGQYFAQPYAVINIYNNQGQSPHDFRFSYNLFNGLNLCTNNFEVISKVNIPTSFNFKIFVNEIDVYTGSVSVPALGKTIFNNAFFECYSPTNKIRIQIIP